MEMWLVTLGEERRCGGSEVLEVRTDREGVRWYKGTDGGTEEKEEKNKKKKNVCNARDNFLAVK